MFADIPKKVTIYEEGPREGFQIESGPIATSDKIQLIEALAETGVRDLQCVSFVNPKLVPGMADAESVAGGIRQRSDVRYTGVWLNRKGLERAAATPLQLSGEIQTSASETFLQRNSNRSNTELLAEQRSWLRFYKENGIPFESAIVMTAFGCNFEGAIEPSRVVECVAQMVDLMEEFEVSPNRVRLADTVGWASPLSVQRVVGALREKWPDMRLSLHLHDTRGSGLPNALAGLMMGIDSFDTACAGLGGCPFAGHKGAAGNICTEDFVFICEEMGIETGLDLDRLIDCALLAERIVGHPLPGKVMHGGSLTNHRL